MVLIIFILYYRTEPILLKHFLYRFKQPTKELMKEILQTNCLSNKHQYCAWSICIYIIHVEHIDKEYAAGVKPEVEIQEPEGQLYVGADQEQEPESEQELTNFYNTPGKHRCMIKPSSIYNWVLQYYYTYALKFIGVDWYLVAWVGFVHPEFLISQIN